MLAASVFNQNDGDVTKAYYAALGKKGYAGMLGVALFRAQKRSTAAKKYRGRQHRSAAYDVKNWSLDQVCIVLKSWDNAPAWGWQRDLSTPGFTWVLYVDLPTGQCSFHSAHRMYGPDYNGKWNAGDGSAKAILRYCDQAWGHLPAPSAEERNEAMLQAYELGPELFTF